MPPPHLKLKLLKFLCVCRLNSQDLYVNTLFTDSPSSYTTSASVSARCDSVSSGYGPGRYWGAASGGDGGQHPEHPLHPRCSTVGLTTHQFGRLALWYCQNTRGKRKLVKSILFIVFFLLSKSQKQHTTNIQSCDSKFSHRSELQ